MKLSGNKPCQKYLFTACSIPAKAANSSVKPAREACRAGLARFQMVEEVPVPKQDFSPRAGWLALALVAAGLAEAGQWCLLVAV